MKASDIFLDPDVVGESEYRMLYDFIDDALHDMTYEDEFTAQEKVAHVRGILNEIITAAEAMKDRLNGFCRSRGL